MALTAIQLAAALRLGDGSTALVEPEASIIARLLAVSSASVTAYAPDAPEDVRDEAAVRFAGYLYDQPSAGAGLDYAQAFRASGAASLLLPWRDIGGSVIGATVGAGVAASREVAAAVTSLLALTDTPSTYTGAARQVLAVNATESGVEFVGAADSTVTDMALADVDSLGGIITFDRFDGSQVQLTIPVYTDANADDRIRAYGQPFTSADETKLDGIASGATAYTDADADARIAAYGQPFTSADETKLDGIAEGATANTDASIDSRINSNARVVDGHEFRAALRRSRTLANGVSYTQAISNAAGELTGKPTLPPNLADTHISVAVTGALTASATFNLSQLLLKPAVSPTDQLSTTNAIGFGPSQTPAFLARRGNSEFLFAASNIGTYSVTITAIEIDIEDSARLSSTAEYTRSKLPAATATEQGAITEDRVRAIVPAGEGGGLNQSQVDARVKAGVEDWAETDGGAIPDDAYTTRHNELVASLVTGGWEQRLADGQIDAARANKLAGGTVPTGLAWDKTTFEQSPRVTNYYIPARVLLAHKTDLANWRIIVTESTGTIATLAGTAWEHIADDSMWAYYQTGQVADLPVGAMVTIERYQPVSFNDKVQFPESPHASLSVLFDGTAAQGITITALSGDKRDPLDHFRRSLDLDDHNRGVLLITANLNITTRAPTTTGFDAAGSDSIVLSDSVALSAIEAANAYAAGTREGVEVWQQALYAAGSQVGVLRLMVAKDANNEVGYYLDYDGSSGTGNCAISMRLDIEFIENDTGGVAAPSGGGGGAMVSTLDISRTRADIAADTYVDATLSNLTGASGQGVTLASDTLTFGTAGVFMLAAQVTPNPSVGGTGFRNLIVSVKLRRTNNTPADIWTLRHILPFEGLSFDEPFIVNFWINASAADTYKVQLAFAPAAGSATTLRLGIAAPAQIIGPF